MMKMVHEMIADSIGHLSERTPDPLQAALIRSISKTIQKYGQTSDCNIRETQICNAIETVW